MRLHTFAVSIPAGSWLPPVDNGLGLVVLLDEHQVFAGAPLEGVDASQQINPASFLHPTTVESGSKPWQTVILAVEGIDLW